MRLDDARLCLDCEEIHEEQECPACGSEVFAFLTRWIQSTSKAKAPLPASATHARSAQDPEHLAAWREITDATPDIPGRGKKIVTRSLLGLAAMGIAGWAWAKTSPSKDEDS
ncbi:MAG: hypothetical protein JJE40_17170 [Vicinamibacteria bacterium]|nr:hypothetical protein [Vicinamibacteria bacterium]